MSCRERNFVKPKCGTSSMADDSGQKRKHLKTVVGQLLAFSHVFKTRPRVAFVEFMHEHQLFHIALRQHLEIYKNLTIGKVYKVTHLQKRQMLYNDGKSVQLLETTQKSSFILLLDSGHMLSEPGLGTVSYEGEVVDSCDSLGIYQMHDGTQLCLTFLTKYADVPLPSVGQRVSVYNAHWWKSECDDKYDLVLCGRSCIVLHGTKQRQSNSQCVLMDQYVNCTYKDLLWLKKQLAQFEEKFNSDFLIENGIVSKSVCELQLTMLIETVKSHYPVKEADIRERFISREFLSSPHQCAVSKSHTFVGTYLTLHELWKRAASRCNPLSSESWNYNVTHYRAGLVGLLSTSHSNGYWTLSDATQSVPCVLAHDTEDFVNLHGAVLLLMKCNLVTEVYQGVNFVYIYFSAKDAHIIHNSGSRSGSNDRLRKTDNSGRICRSHTHGSTDKSALASDARAVEYGNEREQKIRKFNVEDIVGCNLVNKETVVPSKDTWLIVVHHKTTVAKVSGHAHALCCVFVSFIGMIHEVADGCYSTRRQYLLLKGKLLQYVPLLSNNSFYLLTLPGHMFPQTCRLKLKFGVLPDVWGVCLPEETIFLSIDTQQPGLYLDLKSHSYNVSDQRLNEEVGQKELVNIEGVISDRLHTDVKYNSEKIPHAEGYGIPGMKNIVLKLRDRIGSGDEVTLYLSQWSGRAYPFGLIPGARICAMFVAKYKSRDNVYTYFRATALTSIEVLSMPQTVEVNPVETRNSVSDDWGERCILAQKAECAAVGSILCGFLGMVKILKLTVATLCSDCNSDFRGGHCIGCSSWPPSAKLKLTAMCCIEDAFGRIMMYMKDEQVYQFLGLSKQYRVVLTKLISEDGHKIELPQRQWNPLDPLGKRVLQALLKACDKHHPRFHVLCRKMKMNNADAGYQDPVFYCLGLQRPRPTLVYSVHTPGVS